MDKEETCSQDDNIFKGLCESLNARLHLWKVINIFVRRWLVMCIRYLRFCLLNFVDVLRKQGVNVDFGDLANLLDNRIKIGNQIEIKDQV